MHGTKFFAKAILFTLFSPFAGSTAHAQGPGKPLESPRDPAREIAAKHNLDVARWSMTKRKAYEGARDRLEEIVDTYPEFSHMDEVLFLLGEIYFKTEKIDKATDSYSKLVKDFPDSEFAKKARVRLDELKAEPKRITGV
jgi:outer membrane protein assembly factor BamD (BamD/ComL family)